MKKTIRELGVCTNCKGYPRLVTNEDFNKNPELYCTPCKGTGRIVNKIIIEESDDMKEFIEKKCGWVLVEKCPDHHFNNEF